MYPELFHIGSFTVSSFGVMMALAFVVAGFTGRWQFAKRGVRPDFAWVAGHRGHHRRHPGSQDPLPDNPP